MGYVDLFSASIKIFRLNKTNDGRLDNWRADNFLVSLEMRRDNMRNASVQEPSTYEDE